MMTVRFANGFSVVYNDAHYAIRHAEGYTDLYERKDGRWIAQVPTSACVVEVLPACRTFNALDEKRLEGMERELRLLRRRIPLAKLRRR